MARARSATRSRASPRPARGPRAKTSARENTIAGRWRRRRHSHQARHSEQQQQRQWRGELEAEDADHAAFPAAAAAIARSRAETSSTSRTIARASWPISRARSAVTGRRANLMRSASVENGGEPLHGQVGARAQEAHELGARQRRRRTGQPEREIVAQHLHHERDEPPALPGLEQSHALDAGELTLGVYHRIHRRGGRFPAPAAHVPPRGAGSRSQRRGAPAPPSATREARRR